MRPQERQKEAKQHRTSGEHLAKLSAATLATTLAVVLAPELGYGSKGVTPVGHRSAKELVVKPNRQKTLEVPVERRIGIGVHFNCVPMDPEQRELVYKSLEDNHIGWARINLNWNDLEPSQGNWDPKILESLDDCITKAKDSSVRPLIVFQGSPGWANGEKTWNNPPNNPADYSNALSFLAGRYKGIVKGWEIWNEPNLDSFWQGSARQMVDLMKAAYPAIKEADPKAYVLSPGISQSNANYLRDLYKAGAGNYFDVLSTHDYDSPEEIDTGIKAMIKATKDFGDTKKPIWLTEFAVPISSYTTKQDQARFAAQTIKLIRANPRVKAAFWFQAMDAGSGDPWEKGVAAIDGGHPRPVLSALGKAAFGTK